MSDTAIIFLGTYLIIIEAVLAAIYLLTRSPDRKREIFLAAAALILTYFLARLFGIFYSHQEPYVVFGFEPTIYHAPDNSFPSDHAAIASAIAALIFLKNRPLGAVFFLAAILIGVGRVLGGVHYPIDIVFGLLAGILAVAILSFALEKIKMTTP